MALSRYYVISLLQLMTSLKVIALEILFLLIMKYMLTIQAPNISVLATISQENLSFSSATNFVNYCFFRDDGNETKKMGNKFGYFGDSHHSFYGGCTTS